MKKIRNQTSKRPPTVRMMRVFKHIAEKGGSMRKAMVAEGFAPSYADNPQKMLRSGAFAELLDRVGLTDDNIAKSYDRLVNLRTPQKKVFLANRKEVEVPDIGPQGQLRTRTKTVFVHVSDDFIITFMENMPGCRLIGIQTFEDKKIAHYTAPNDKALKAGLELTAKSKGLMAPEKHDVGIFHEPTEEEKKIIKEILSTNKP